MTDGHYGLAERIADVLRDKLRLVATGGEPCESCGEYVEYTYKVKDGCITDCATAISELVFDAMASGQISAVSRDK